MEIESYFLLFILFIGVIGSFGLFYMLAQELLSVYRNVSALSWPKTTGKLLSAGVEKVEGEGVTYKPKIKYSYCVDGHYYESNIYSFGIASIGDKHLSSKICLELNKQEEILVFYKPGNPSCALLKPGISDFSAKSLMLVIFFSFLFSPVHLIWLLLYNFLFVWEI